MGMSIFYAAVWLILSGWLFYQAFRLSRFLIAPALFFLFLGGWSLADALLAVDLMNGVWGWIYRGVAVVALLICALKYYLYKKNG